MTVSARRLANAVWRTGELPAELPPCMNKPVRCTGGGTVGKIMDVVLDDSSGTILFCVVSFGSMPHFGDDCRVVPFDVVQLDSKTGHVVVTLDPETLRDAPIFLPGHEAMDQRLAPSADAAEQIGCAGIAGR